MTPLMHPSPFADLAGLARSRHGTHYSHLYAGADDLAEAVVPFITAGLRNNERCLWVTCQPLDRAAALEALGRLVPDLAARIAAGQLDILGHDEWYRAHGRLNAGTVIEGWLQREREALAAGHAGLRITGNTFWLETPDEFATFAEYERRLHAALAGHRIVCLCSYCLDRCSAATLLDIARNHDFVMVRRDGAWEILEQASLAQAKAELAAELAHKDTLLSEIHHRVKNNLQIVSSLLLLKGDLLRGPEPEVALADIQSRIRAMALVHELLYRDGNGADVHFGAYLRQLAAHLAEAYAAGTRIAITLAETGAAAPLLDLDTAIPLGLAVAEAVTNALKHAFPDGRAGRVAIALDSDANGIRVAVRDDGRGLPPPGDRRPGAGLALLRSLAAQAGGTVALEDVGGLQLTIRVPRRGE